VTTCAPSGNLPPGLQCYSFSPYGLGIRGTPNLAGTYIFSLTTGETNAFSLTVNNPAAPPGSITVSTNSLNFIVSPNGQPQSLPIQVGSTSGPTPFFAGASLTSPAPTNWLTIDKNSGVTPTTIVATANPKGLAPGRYTGNIVIGVTSSGATGDKGFRAADNSQTVSVSITVSSDSIYFYYLTGGPQPAPKPLAVNPVGAATASFTAVPTTNPPANNWLNISSSSTTAPTTLMVSVSPAGLSAGVYSGAVNLTVAGNPTPVAVFLVVLSTASVQLTFNYLIGGATPAPQIQPLGDNPQQPFFADISMEGGNWLTVNPSSGTLSPAPLTPVSFAVNPAGLGAGVYRALVVIVDNAPQQPFFILVTFTVGSGAVSGSCSSGATNKIIPQVTDGGPWQTTVVVINTGQTMANACLSFFQDTGNGATSAWPLQMANGVSYQSIQLQPGSLIFLQTLGTAPTLTQGWAQLTADAGVEAFAIFKERVPGRQDQEGTAPAVSAGQDILVPFDNTGGNATSMAIVNGGGTSQTYVVTLRVPGRPNASQNIQIPAGGHLAFALTDQFGQPAAGVQGVVEFTSTGNPASVIAFRFNSTGAFTSVPTQAAAPGGSTTGCTPFATSKVIPQVTDGGAWQATVVVINTGQTVANACLSFFQDTQNGATSPWPLQMMNGAPYQLIQLQPGAIVFLQTPAIATTLTQGWAQVIGDPGIQAFAIFKQRVPGRQDQEGTAPAVSAGQDILAPFDNTNGNTTSMAIVNGGSSAQSYTATLRAPGKPSATQIIQIPAGGHLAFAVTDQFGQPAAGVQGVIEITSTGNPVSVIAFRFNSSGAFTSVPTLAATGH
jgi:hypothetical protein